MNEFDYAHDLVNDYELAEVIDCKVSDLRKWLAEEPHKLPRPLRFGSMLRWPAQQISAWVQAGGPPNFQHGPEDFCPEWLCRLADYQAANVEFKDDSYRKLKLAALLTMPVSTEREF